ncbi:LysR family transcriptional regulator [Hyphobacterium sp.]|uniref:LysR family transcriptional regulator n=1 Tax=Hyphobacterium sp. TaxID=2004662 RepID=UPI003BA8F5C3
MRPTLRQLEYFVAVADALAFGPAAQKLAVTQPSLSKQLASMEVELGVRLFERTSRSVRLTAAGEQLLGEAKELLDAASAFKNKARRLGRKAGQRFKAGALPSIGAYLLPRFMERLRGERYDTRFSVREGVAAELLAKLADGEFDFVVASESKVSGLVSRHLFDESLWISSHPGDPLMAPNLPVRLEELAGRTLITVGPDFYLSDVAHDLAALAKATVSDEYQGASLDAVRRMADSGAGIAVLPSLYALGEAVRDPAFAVRRIDHVKASHPVFLHWRRSNPDPELFNWLGDELVFEAQNIRREQGEIFVPEKPAR